MNEFGNQPYLCSYCGNFFKSDLGIIALQGSVIIESSETTCPKCGNLAKGQHDLILLIDSSISVFQNLKIEELINLKSIFDSAKNADFSEKAFENIKESVEKIVPELQHFKDIYPKTRMEFYTIIGFLITIILFTINAITSNTKVDEKKIKEIIFIKETVKQPIIYNPSRNDLCPCGSGKKFKKCHGALL